MLKIIAEKCTGCEICIDKCPFDALKMENNTAVVDKKSCTMCGICVKSCEFEAIKLDKEKTKKNKDFTDYSGVWVLAEQRENKLMEVSLELVSEGRKLADKLNEELSAVVLGSDIKDGAQKLIAHGADNVYLIEDERLKDYRTGPYTSIISEMINKFKPEIVILGATHNGRDLGPRISARINTGLTADCTELSIEEKRGILLQTRPAFGGNLMATIICPEHRPQMATVRPKVMEKTEPDYNRVGQIRECKFDLDQDKIDSDIIKRSKIIKLDSNTSNFDFYTEIKKIVKEAHGNVNLEDADIIVAGGRGVGDPEGFKTIKNLAKTLNGEVGASRAVVDEGWIDKEHQVGQTGKTVKPKVYIACGISGAIQHKAGMNKSDIIIAVNTDLEAPIFEACDYGIVGDLHQILPMLTEAFDKILN